MAAAGQRKARDSGVGLEEEEETWNGGGGLEEEAWDSGSVKDEEGGLGDGGCRPEKEA